MQVKVALLEKCVLNLGKKVNADWHLASLSADTLIIEDTSNHNYYTAKHRKDVGGTVVIDNIKPLKIVENKKRASFNVSCQQLVNAISENNRNNMSVSWNKMAKQQFSGRTIPQNGIVRTHDGVLRMVNVASESIIDENIRPKLISAIVDGLTDDVVIEDGRPVSATFVGSKLKLPISEWLCRKSVARNMRRVAQEAYWAEGFQHRIRDIAKLVCEDKIVEAVDLAVKFLNTEQEFTLLNREQSQTLIENTLAATGCYNQKLCDDVASLFWRTNLRVNRDVIISEWTRTAKIAAHPTLLENVQILNNAKDFEPAFDRFITLVFNEAMGPKDVQVDAYSDIQDNEPC